MTAEQQEGNKLIAEFMGYKTWEGIVWIQENISTSINDWAKYHSSWDWLYPVIEKILKTWSPESGEWPYEYLQLRELHVGISIENIYPKVVAFIKWFNNQNKQP